MTRLRIAAYAGPARKIEGHATIVVTPPGRTWPYKGDHFIGADFPMSIGDGLMKLANMFPGLVKKVQDVDWLNAFLNQQIINGLVEKTAARPQPFSLWTPTPIHVGADSATPVNDIPVDYVSWTGLVDRRFTGRHLPPASEAYQNGLPSIDDVLALYKRSSFTASTTTSAFLCFFAQWFTDSVLRTNFFDRRLNWSNHEIDLCEIYGQDANMSAILREKKGGRLKTSANGLFPARLTDATTGRALPEFADLPYLQPYNGVTIEDFVMSSLGAPDDVTLERKKHLYATGLERGNSTLVYVAISTIFLREHNRLCSELAKAYPSWDDDQLFETARNINIVMLLTLTINEYINHLGQAPFKLKLPKQNFAENTKWYRANRIAIEFSLLYRWHSLTPDRLEIDGRKLDNQDFRFNNALLEHYGVEAIIAAASRQPAGRIGMGNNPSFLEIAERNAHMFARAQRVRPFVEYQKAFSETPVTSFEDLAGNTPLAKSLKSLYGRVENVEFLVGLFAQQQADSSVLPALMGTMVAVDAFSQILTNPLIATNVRSAAFSGIGADIIEGTHSFQDLVARNKAPGATDIFASFALH